MNLDIWIVTSILAATIVALVLDRFRPDMVALVSLLTLTLSGILTPVEAIAGFSNSLVLMIAGLFVVGGAILETGVADLVGNKLGRIGGTSTVRLTVSNTATSLLIAPLALELSQRIPVSTADGRCFGSIDVLFYTHGVSDQRLSDVNTRCAASTCVDRRRDRGDYQTFRPALAVEVIIIGQLEVNRGSNKPADDSIVVHRCSVRELRQSCEYRCKNNCCFYETIGKR